MRLDLSAQGLKLSRGPFFTCALDCSRAMLTGLGPEAAQVLTSLGLDLSELTALRSLKEGLHAAVAR